MAKTIKEYRDIIENGGMWDAFIAEGWENLVDNLIDYDSIPVDWDKDDDSHAWALRDEEERKVAIALREFLEGKIEDYVSSEFYKRTEEESDEINE